MTVENGNHVTRAELAAHIKGIDERFKDVADDISEIKFAVHGITDAMRMAGANSFLGGRGRKFADALMVALIAAAVSLAFAFIPH